MKTIKTPAIITSISSKQDGSLGLRLSTPELSPDEKVAFLEIQGLNTIVMIQPTDFESKEIKEVKGELDTKTPSKRLRSTIFVWWKQQGEPGDFAVFYAEKMEKLIDFVKSKLD